MGKKREQVTLTMKGRATLVLGVLTLVGLLVFPLLPLASAASGDGTVVGSFVVSGPSPTATSTPPPSPTPTATPGCEDNYEEDDTPQSASSIGTTGVSQVHSFHQSGDLDYIEFQAVTGSSYTIAATSLTASTDVGLLLYGSDILTDQVARPLVGSDGSGPGGLSLFAWQAPQSGTYYIKVRELFDRGNCLWYCVSVTETFMVYLPSVGSWPSPKEMTTFRLPSFASSPGFGTAVSSRIRPNLSLARGW